MLLLDMWQRSGFTARDFGALVGVNKATLFEWKKRFDRSGPAGLSDKARGAPSKRSKKALLLTIQRRKAPPVVRAHVCEALGLVGGTSAVPTLRLCLRDDSPAVRLWAAYALGTLTATEAIPDLARLAQSDRRKVPHHGTVAREAKWAIDDFMQSSKSGSRSHPEELG